MLSMYVKESCSGLEDLLLGVFSEAAERTAELDARDAPPPIPNPELTEPDRGRLSPAARDSVDALVDICPVVSSECTPVISSRLSSTFGPSGDFD